MKDSCEIVWHFKHLSIRVEVQLERDWLSSEYDHLEIRSIDPSRHPLPITETGYRSHWPEPGSYLSAKEIAVAVREWLDEGASSAEWQRYVDDLQQPSLF